MVRSALAIALVFGAATAAFAQTTPADSPALQALVSEIHQLRQEMQSTTIAAQRVQIALFRLQAQTTTVARAAARVDDAHSKALQAQANQKELAARIQRMEETERTIQDVHEREAIAGAIPQMKMSLDHETAEWQRWSAAETEAASQFRTEQAKLDDLQSLLDKLDKVLDGYSRK